MRLVIVGATGNVGTSLIRALEYEQSVDEIVGIARRKPDISLPKTQWREMDITRDPLDEAFKGAGAVVHLAWAIQPSHNLDAMRRVNLLGTERVLQAVAASGVKNLVYASSVGSYSPGPKDRLVDESWPTNGIISSTYSRHKALAERLVESFEDERRGVRVVRLRKALVFKGEAASEARRLFFGPFFPNFLASPKLLKILPEIKGMVTQAVHSYDVGEAYRLALVSSARGPFNIAADPLIDTRTIARVLGAAVVPVSAKLMRLAALVTWRLHLQPTEPGWLDLALQSPLLDPTRARQELGWVPQRTAIDAVLELLQGLSRERGFGTPPLSPEASGPLRSTELKTGMGEISEVRAKRGLRSG